MNDIRKLRAIKELEWDELKVSKGVYKGGIRVYEGTEDSIPVVFGFNSAFVMIGDNNKVESDIDMLKSAFLDDTEQMLYAEEGELDDVVQIGWYNTEDEEEEEEVEESKVFVDSETLEQWGINDMLVINDIERRLEAIGALDSGYTSLM